MRPLSPVHTRLQLVFDIFISVGHKDRAKDLCPLVGPRIQQRPELPLRDHGDLLELIFIYAKQVSDRLIDLGQALDRRFAVLGKYCFFLLCDHAASPELRPLIGRAPPHAKAAPLMRKSEFHIAFDIGRGIFAAQVLLIPIAAAGFPVERKTDGVENRGLSCAGVARDQEKPFFFKAVEADLRNKACIWSEGADNE